jgi:hypothetical protein
MYNVRQLQNHEIETIRKELQKINWLKKVESQFNNAPFFDNRNFLNHPYLGAWNSNEIITEAQKPGFVLNVEYKSLNILPKPINLTKLAGIKFDNRKISRLKSRYYLENFMNNLDQSKPLFKYLKGVK